MMMFSLDLQVLRKTLILERVSLCIQRTYGVQSESVLPALLWKARMNLRLVVDCPSFDFIVRDKCALVFTVTGPHRSSKLYRIKHNCAVQVFLKVR